MSSCPRRSLSERTLSFSWSRLVDNVAIFQLKMMTKKPCYFLHLSTVGVGQLLSTTIEEDFPIQYCEVRKYLRLVRLPVSMQ